MATDPALIATLYADERPRLLRRFRRRGLSAPQASDLVQDTFMRLLRSRNDEIRDLRAYLYRAADSAERDLWRSDARKRAVIDATVEPDTECPDPGPAVEATLITRQERAALGAALDRLPPRPREVLMLHRFDNLSYAEIAARLGISRNTVMVHMVRALNMLRKQLNDPGQGGDMGAGSD